MRRRSRLLTSRTVSSSRHRPHQRRSRFEQLEDRRMLAGDTVGSLAYLNDEFDSSSSVVEWNRVNQVEGWNADQLQVWDIDQSQTGRMVMQPHTTTWFQDWRGPMAFKEVSGDFVFTSEVVIADRDDLGDSDADSVPDDAQFSLGGVMIRTPRNIHDPVADWQPGSRSDDGTNTGENYVFLSLGHGVDGQFSFEVKTTRNSDSDLELTPLGAEADRATLRLARVGTAVIAMYRFPGEQWVVHRRYDRPDLPETLQLGLVTYSDWEKAGDFDPFFQNSNVLEPGVTDPSPGEPYNPDLVAGFEFAHFARPSLPPELHGADLIQGVTDQELLSFLGTAADSSPIEQPVSPATVTVEATDPAAHETGDPGEFTLTRVGADLSAPLQVSFEVTGSASAGVDYASIGGSVTFAADESTTTVAVAPLLDSLVGADEGTETVQLELIPGAAYELGAGPNAAVVEIQNAHLLWIPDQVMSRSDDRLDIDLSSLLNAQFSVTVVENLAAQLTVAHNLYVFADDFGENWGGQSEKWLMGEGGYYYLLPDASLHLWNGSFASSTQLAVLTESYYADPSRLVDAVSLPVNVEVVESQLQVDPAAEFMGEFHARLMVEFVSGSYEQTFLVAVENAAPTFVSIEDQTLQLGALPLQIPISATDPDGDPLSYEVEVQGSLIEQVMAEHDLYESPSIENYGLNWGGQNEKWVSGNSGWYFLLPGGSLNQWNGSFEASSEIAQLGSEVYEDPQLLLQADGAPPVSAQVIDRVLSLSAEIRTGVFEIIVRATDGSAVGEASFQLEVFNSVPVLSLEDQTAEAGTPLLIELPTVDADGQLLTLNVEVLGDELGQLDSQYGFWSDGDYYTNYLGQDERWLRDADRNWHYLLPEGTLHRWSGSFESSSLIADLGTSVYSDPTLLTDPSLPPAATSISEGTLAVEVPPGYSGTVYFRVTASDGVSEVVEEFSVLFQVPSDESAAVDAVYESWE